MDSRGTVVMHATFCFDLDLCIDFLEGRKNFLQNICKGYDFVVMFLRNCQELKSDNGING